MIHVFIVQARRGLLGADMLIVAASVDSVVFRPRVLASAPDYLAKLSTCCIVSSFPASSIGLAMAVLVASSLAN